MTDDVAEKIFGIVARTFGLAPSELSNSTTADDIDGWDSLSHATLLIRIEKAFNIDLDMSAANQAQDLGALIDLVRAAQ